MNMNVLLLLMKVKILFVGHAEHQNPIKLVKS